MTDIRDDIMEPTADEIERVQNAIVQAAREYKGGPKTMARAAILAMDRRAAAPAGAKDGEPLYRFLKPGETIERGDECPDDQAHRWEPVTGVFIGMRYGGAMKTVRRRASPPAEPDAWQHCIRVSKADGGKVKEPFEWGDWSEWREGKFGNPGLAGQHLQFQERALYASPRAPAVAVPEGYRDAMLNLMAALAAAISLLERYPKAKKAAPSDKMFGQMLVDYRTSLERARAFLAAAPEPPAAEAPGQEPVAYMHKNGAIWRLDNYPAGMDFSEPGWVPLYAAPTTYADAEAKEFERGIEAAARIVEGQPYGEGADDIYRYRTWDYWPTLPNGTKGNRSVDDFLVKHCDALATAIRSLASPAPKGET